MKFPKAITIISFLTLSGLDPVYTRVVENSKRLIKTNADSPAEIIHTSELFDLIRRDITFVDITDFEYTTFPIQPARQTEFPIALRYNATVSKAMQSFNWTRMWVDLSELDTTRYFATDNKALQYLLPEINSILNPNAILGSATVIIVDHGLQGFQQRSIIVRLPGSDPVLKDEVVILGAHLDTITRKGPHGHAPGVDDNASGSSVLLETFRALVDSETILKRTLELHWYAAEEVGLRGSQAIAQEYMRRNKNICGVLNFDAIGYHVEGVNYLGVFTDDGNDGLLQFVRLLTEQYLDYGWMDRSCGFACSDHASWSFNGYPAGMVGNVVSNPTTHTDSDDGVDKIQANEYFKLAVAFVIELGETLTENEIAISTSTSERSDGAVDNVEN